MNEEQQGLLRMARENVEGARLLAEQGLYKLAASRAYYAMFHIARAFLEGKGLRYSKHSAVIAAFGKHFAKAGEVSAQYHRYLIDARDMRIMAEYDPTTNIPREEALTQISRAEEFLALAADLIGPIPSPDEESA